MRHSARLPLSFFPGENSKAGGALPRGLAAGWVVLGLLVVGFASALNLASTRFGYAYDVAEMPILALVAGLVAAGLVFCLVLPRLIRSSLDIDARAVRWLTAGIILAGLAARLLLIGSEPMLEDDYQRYLWDGAVTASGLNPYSVAPMAARNADSDTTLGRLASEAGPVIRRINHPDIKTIYPPIAQGAFALAHLIEPFGLSAWRAILLFCEGATLLLIFALLAQTGRSPLWAALYWWNPLVIKELANSAHMDAVVLPLVMLALLMSLSGRAIAASTSIALAVGAKIWPLLLLPLALRPLAARPRALAGALMIFAALVALFAMPMLRGGLDANAGLTAYVTHWQTSSALFPALQHGTATLLSSLGLAHASPGTVVRVGLALVLAGLALRASLAPIASADDLMGRASLIVAALVLLSPAQFPWYAVWFAPFLAFRPWGGFLLLTATAPLYYLSFYFSAMGAPELFRHNVVWMIWVPVWAALVWEAGRNWIGAPIHREEQQCATD